MRQISYVLQFTGRATPQEGAATVLKATTTAPSSSLKGLAKYNLPDKRCCWSRGVASRLEG
jgi:hypothetical protein